MKSIKRVLVQALINLVFFVSKVITTYQRLKFKAKALFREPKLHPTLERHYQNKIKSFDPRIPNKPQKRLPEVRPSKLMASNMTPLKKRFLEGLSPTAFNKKAR